MESPADQPPIHPWIVTEAGGDEALLAHLLDWEETLDHVVAGRMAGQAEEPYATRLNRVGEAIVARKIELGMLDPDGHTTSKEP